MLIIFLYFLVESLAFYLVAKAIGVGWALLALAACFLLGVLIAAGQFRSITRKLESGRTTPGAGLGDTGLVLAGCLGVFVPGFVTAFLGLLLIIPPTRKLIRRGLAHRARRWLESVGAKTYEMTHQQATGNTYGSFVVDAQAVDVTDQPHTRKVNPEEEKAVEDWAQNIRPEDFTGGNDTPKK